jgi:lipid A disaccharide synthetase
MVRRKPTIVVYKTGWLFHQLADRLMTCEYISLVNLLASKELYPEFAGHGDFTQGIAEQMVRWLQHPEQLQSVVEELDKLNSQVTVPGAIDRAADFLLQDIPSYKKVTS